MRSLVIFLVLIGCSMVYGQPRPRPLPGTRPPHPVPQAKVRAVVTSFKKTPLKQLWLRPVEVKTTVVSLPRVRYGRVPVLSSLKMEVRAKEYRRVKKILFVQPVMRGVKYKGGGRIVKVRLAHISIPYMVWEVQPGEKISYRLMFTRPGVYMIPRFFGQDEKGNRYQSSDVIIEVPCNKNRRCEPALGEDYSNCPSDCPTGSKDGTCDEVTDGRCDPDCTGEKPDLVDPDCRR